MHKIRLLAATLGTILLQSQAFAQASWQSTTSDIQTPGTKSYAFSNDHYVYTATLGTGSLEETTFKLASIFRNMPNRYREATVYCENYSFLGMKDNTLIVEATSYTLNYPTGSEEGKSVNESVAAGLSDSLFTTELNCLTPEENADFVKTRQLYIPNGSTVRFDVLGQKMDIRLTATSQLELKAEYVK